MAIFHLPKVLPKGTRNVDSSGKSNHAGPMDLVSSSQKEAQFLKVGEVAKNLHVHESTVSRWSKQGLLHSIGVGARRDRLFLKNEVNNLKEDLNSFSRVGTQSIHDLNDSMKLESGGGFSRNESQFDLWRLGKVAKVLGVHENTVRRWSNQGLLEPIRVGKRRDRLFLSREVTNLMNKWGNDPETIDKDVFRDSGKRAGRPRILPSDRSKL